jgi:cell division protein FtsX
MRRLLGVFVVLIVCVIAVGFYMKWFSISTSNRTVDDNTISVQVTVDPDKAKEDAEALKDKATDIAGNDD